MWLPVDLASHLKPGWWRPGVVAGKPSDDHAAVFVKDHGVDESVAVDHQLVTGLAWHKGNSLIPVLAFPESDA